MDWTSIDESFCDSRRESDEAMKERLVRFFDGSSPTWQDVLAGLPRREAADHIVPRREAADHITQSLLHEPATSAQLHLVIGASGEGKSTLIRQVAVDVALSSPTWRVLWREYDAPLDPERVEALPRDVNYLLVADDADQIVDDCFLALRRLGHRSNTHFLLATRDTDWIAAGGDAHPWRTLDVTIQRHTLRGLNRHDARRIVEAWARASALGQLASYNSVDERADLLWNATLNEASTEEGALLGGMLRVRFGDRLDDHVLAMLRRLATRKIPTGRTLAYAFLLIAALHAINLKEMTPEVLGEALGLAPETVSREVVRQLGEEAAAVPAGRLILVRHRAVAEAAMRVARTRLSIDLAELYALLTRAGIRAARRSYSNVNPRDFRYMSKFLKDDPALAQASAEAALQEEPDDLRRVVNLLVVLGQNKQDDELVRIAEQTLPRLNNMVNRDEAIRRYYYEWSVAEGKRGQHTIACWLTAVSLSDLPGADPLRDERDVEFRLAGFAPGMKALAGKLNDSRFQHGLHAVVTLLRNWPMNPRTKRDLAGYRKYLDMTGSPEPDFDACRADLVAAIHAAWEQRERLLPSPVPSTADLRFERLFAMLAHHWNEDRARQ